MTIHFLFISHRIKNGGDFNEGKNKIFLFVTKNYLLWCCCGTLKVKRIRMDFEGETCVKVEKPEKMRTKNNPHKLLLTILFVPAVHEKYIHHLMYFKMSCLLLSEIYCIRIISIHLVTMRWC